jgi:hypothetical protein
MKVENNTSMTARFIFPGLTDHNYMNPCAETANLYFIGKEFDDQQGIKVVP